MLPKETTTLFVLLLQLLCCLLLGLWIHYTITLILANADSVQIKRYSKETIQTSKKWNAMTNPKDGRRKPLAKRTKTCNSTYSSFGTNRANIKLSLPWLCFSCDIFFAALVKCKSQDCRCGTKISRFASNFIAISTVT